MEKLTIWEKVRIQCDQDYIQSILGAQRAFLTRNDRGGEVKKGF